MDHAVNIGLIISIGGKRNLVLILPEAFNIGKVVLFSVLAVFVSAKNFFEHSVLRLHRILCKIVLFGKRNITKKNTKI